MVEQGKETLNKSNVLSIENLKKKHEQAFTESEGIVDLLGEKENFFFYNKFPHGKINEFLTEYLEFNFNGLTQGIEQDMTDEEKLEFVDQTMKDAQAIATPYMSLLLVAKFTSLGEVIPDDLDGRIVYMKMLMDFGTLNDIVEQLPEDEVAKVYQELSSVIERKLDSAMTMIEENTKNIAEIEDLSARRAIENELSKFQEEVVKAKK